MVFWIVNSEHIAILGAEVDGCGNVGVCISNSSDVTVYRCNLHSNSWAAVTMWDSHSVYLVDNLVQGNGQFIEAHDVERLEVSGNRVSNFTLEERMALQFPGIQRAE